KQEVPGSSPGPPIVAREDPVQDRGPTGANSRRVDQAWQTMSTTPPIQSALASLDQATQWLNSDPLTARGLLGRTVAVDFCTYSCVNWLRTLPYRRAWHERYSADGLVVVGAHAPEFGFEHDLGNVRRAIA